MTQGHYLILQNEECILSSALNALEKLIVHFSYHIRKVFGKIDFIRWKLEFTKSAELNSYVSGILAVQPIYQGYDIFFLDGTQRLS